MAITVYTYNDKVLKNVATDKWLTKKEVSLYTYTITISSSSINARPGLKSPSIPAVSGYLNDVYLSIFDKATRAMTASELEAINNGTASYYDFGMDYDGYIQVTTGETLNNVISIQAYSRSADSTLTVVCNETQESKSVTVPDDSEDEGIWNTYTFTF